MLEFEGGVEMKKIIVSLFLAVSLVFLTDPGDAQQKAQLPVKQISIGTAGTAGTYYIVGAGISKMITGLGEVLNAPQPAARITGEMRTRAERIASRLSLKPSETGFFSK